MQTISETTKDKSGLQYQTH